MHHHLVGHLAGELVAVAGACAVGCAGRWPREVVGRDLPRERVLLPPPLLHRELLGLVSVRASGPRRDNDCRARAGAAARGVQGAGSVRTEDALVQRHVVVRILVWGVEEDLPIPCRLPLRRVLVLN